MAKWRFAGLTWFCALLCSAQTPTGSIEGFILAPSGVLVPGATVKITETETGHVIPLVPDGTGRYAASNLLPAFYGLLIEAPGFRTYKVTNIRVNAGEAWNGSVTLLPGRASFVVTVAAAANSVGVTSHAVEIVITDKEIKDFPMFGRNFLDLASLAPGVVVRSAGGLDPTKAGPAYRAVGIAGRLGTGTRMLFEGIDLTDPVGGGTLVNISPEAVREFQLTQSSHDVSAPPTSTGSIQIVGIGGGNGLHGSGFWNFYNESLGARPNYEPTTAPFHRHQAGGSLGGRFIEDSCSGSGTWRPHANLLSLSLAS